jgi:mannose-6-phosphate isomerase-like protein (cupin superfamily)
MLTIDLASKFDLIDDHWHPRVVASLNGQDVKIAKIQGEFVWHAHDDEDELFFVFKGELTMHFRDRSETIGAGQMVVVPRGVEHRPQAHEEAWIVLFEPQAIDHTGGVDSPLRRTTLQRI